MPLCIKQRQTHYRVRGPKMICIATTVSTVTFAEPVHLGKVASQHPQRQHPTPPAPTCCPECLQESHLFAPGMAPFRSDPSTREGRGAKKHMASSMLLHPTAASTSSPPPPIAPSLHLWVPSSPGCRNPDKAAVQKYFLFKEANHGSSAMLNVSIWPACRHSQQDRFLSLLIDTQTALKLRSVH